MSACLNCERNSHHACVRAASQLSRVFADVFGHSMSECGCFDASPSLHRTLATAKREVARG